MLGKKWSLRRKIGVSLFSIAVFSVGGAVAGMFFSFKLSDTYESTLKEVDFITTEFAKIENLLANSEINEYRYFVDRDPSQIEAFNTNLTGIQQSTSKILNSEAHVEKQDLQSLESKIIQYREIFEQEQKFFD